MRLQRIYYDFGGHISSSAALKGGEGPGFGGTRYSPCVFPTPFKTALPCQPYRHISSYVVAASMFPYQEDQSLAFLKSLDMIIRCEMQQELVQLLLICL